MHQGLDLADVRPVGFPWFELIYKETMHIVSRRYREKRKNRKFEKTIRYASRKAYAEVRVQCCC